jgi:hypothetical protein
MGNVLAGLFVMRDAAFASVPSWFAISSRRSD